MIGVVGGGQLARMLVQAARTRSIPVAVQTKWENDPAVDGAERVVVADPRDVAGTLKLMEGCDGITFENEWVSIDALIPLERQGACFYPALEAFAPLVDKLSQRQLLEDLAIPSPLWCPLSQISQAQPGLPQGWDFPVMAKAARGGYDGKGTAVINNVDALAQLLRSVEISGWFLEAWVHFERELALVVSRDANGRLRSFPLVETYQNSRVCDWVLVPACVEQAVEALAYNMAASLLTKLNYVGVLALEFFYGPSGLQVNEIAPRTHNSGHFSIEACTSSQFDQQVCIAAGLPTPIPEMRSEGALMVNLLGLDPAQATPLAQRLTELRQLPKAHLHWYGKSPESPGRKLGHVTVLLNAKDAIGRQREARYVLRVVRQIWPGLSVHQD
ncbi:5-(carboxyamino)imidazole ribonucleotide synthase [Synechococcus sp. M16CYN]|uniref:5-(carboxyamino)imidazole ribonucleotide synthase n=1 Tax=Synechococcus sp. M16CYN TaxID=3103139 RepID=UPI00333FC6EE